MNENKLKNTPTYYYVFCWWVWLWAFLFYVDIVPYSPLPLLIMSFIFTVFHNIYNIFISFSNIIFKIFIVFWELLILLVIYNKKNTFTLLDVLFGIFIFIIYNLYLIIYLDTNFYYLYFVYLKKKIEKRGHLDKFFYSNKNFFILLFSIGLFKTLT